MTPGLLATDGVHLSQMGKGSFVQELTGLTERHLKGERDKSKPARHEPGGSVPVSEEQCAREVL